MADARYYWEVACGVRGARALLFLLLLENVSGERPHHTQITPVAVPHAQPAVISQSSYSYRRVELKAMQ